MLFEIESYRKYLTEQEKAESTIRKYVSDVIKMHEWLGEKELNKISLLEYKQHLAASCSAISVNAAIAAINSFLEFSERSNLKLSTMKIQKCAYRSSDRELDRDEYFRLIETAEKTGNLRLSAVMQTICATGIRVSELQYITVEAVKNGTAEVNMKGKVRTLLLPGSLCRMLTKYIKQNNIQNGCIFITRNGKPMDRSNIWAGMKKLCAMAEVEPSKVFPHNLRHLFARTFIKKEKDIVKLSAILGHSSVQTTMIYTMESSEKHRRLIENLGLVRRCVG